MKSLSKWIFGEIYVEVMPQRSDILSQSMGVLEWINVFLIILHLFRGIDSDVYLCVAV